MTSRSGRETAVDAVDVIASAVECVAALVAHFPNAKVSHVTCVAYARSLVDLPPDVLERAVARCIATCEFFPTIAKIRAAAMEEGAAAGRFPLVAAAWGEVERAFGTVGSRGTPRWSHPLIASAVSQLGWERICQSKPDVIRGQFARAYGELLERARADRASSPLVERARHTPLAETLAGLLSPPSIKSDARLDVHSVIDVGEDDDETDDDQVEETAHGDE